MNWYATAIPEIFAELETNEHGLSAAVAKRRLQEFGANELPKGKTPSLFTLFL
ncbi:MAG TPA: cation-transporting P-type ATPase, partial [Candidatus Paceibacterota bacterium]|nr:cation-transporting P-type ATPase [Candidatus Paceibacterota bacterium]